MCEIRGVIGKLCNFEMVLYHIQDDDSVIRQSEFSNFTTLGLSHIQIFGSRNYDSKIGLSCKKLYNYRVHFLYKISIAQEEELHFNIQ